MDKQLFMQQAKSQFLQIFQKSKASQVVTVEKHRTEGFLYAGELLGLTDKNELQQLMEQAHLEVFGYPLQDRSAGYQQQRKAALSQGQFQYFDEPAINRRV
ncbi:MAG: hypothetical protein KJ930_02360 [Gammaproteobacteria bacterium]|nr:hypothetical protein [Gammaproteobacteria bacterium]MBU2178253.1 hypothetical protein [Gammaproteobacteria bacterium]MBU2224835.1 hypothetical protein [Gammaproteobacteria bacterium]MBU2277649.1 hypothetical protein [Gammaproteobacteria bacterium]MBU2427643.1 hypothetical protein [Gammaproteobacteria bacterium]